MMLTPLFSESARAFVAPLSIKIFAAKVVKKQRHSPNATLYETKAPVTWENPPGLSWALLLQGFALAAAELGRWKACLPPPPIPASCGWTCSPQLVPVFFKVQGIVLPIRDRDLGC